MLEYPMQAFHLRHYVQTAAESQILGRKCFVVTMRSPVSEEMKKYILNVQTHSDAIFLFVSAVGGFFTVEAFQSRKSPQPIGEVIYWFRGAQYGTNAGSFTLDNEEFMDLIHCRGLHAIGD